MKNMIVSCATGVVSLVGVASAAPLGALPLGNLFDDPKGSTLSAAIASDQFRAAADVTDLGVELVRAGMLGGVVTIAPNITFDTGSAGGANTPAAVLPSNDSISNLNGIGISTTGVARSPVQLARVEDGIGMWADQLITFNLDEIRAAGGFDLQTTNFLFTARGAINDFSGSSGTVSLLALVSDATGVIAGWANGVPVSVSQSGGTGSQFAFASVLPLSLSDRSRVADFNVPIPAEGKYLTLASLSMGDSSFADHGVFGGASLLANAVPGPGSLGLALIGGGCIGLRRRRGAARRD